MSEAESAKQPVFNIEKIYVKDLSLEIPHAPGIFLERENPHIDLQLHSQATAIEEGLFEVMITITVTSRLKEKDKVAFLIEARQAGIFQVRNLPQQEVEQVLGVVCPNIVFPFLREVVSDLAVRAGFSPVLLNPINFDVLYQQQKQLQAQATPVTKH